MEPVARYVFEAGMLKRVKRSGWWAERIDEPESVADHSFRTAVIAFVLAKMEGMDQSSADRICSAAVFHDMQETRLGDMHKITARYIQVTPELEAKVEEDQIRDLPPAIKDSLPSGSKLSPKEKTILKDADYLECAFQAKEYSESGYEGVLTWVEKIGERLKSESAKKLHAKMRRMESNSWWKGLKRLD